MNYNYNYALRCCTVTLCSVHASTSLSLVSTPQLHAPDHHHTCCDTTRTQQAHPPCAAVGAHVQACIFLTQLCTNVALPAHPPAALLCLHYTDSQADARVSIDEIQGDIDQDPCVCPFGSQKNHVKDEYAAVVHPTAPHNTTTCNQLASPTTQQAYRPHNLTKRAQAKPIDSTYLEAADNSRVTLLPQMLELYWQYSTASAARYYTGQHRFLLLPTAPTPAVPPLLVITIKAPAHPSPRLACSHSRTLLTHTR